MVDVAFDLGALGSAYDLSFGALLWNALSLFACLPCIAGNHAIAAELFRRFEIGTGTKASYLIVGAGAKDGPVAEVFASTCEVAPVSGGGDVAPGSIASTPCAVSPPGLCTSRAGRGSSAAGSARVATPGSVAPTDRAFRLAPCAVASTLRVSCVGLKESHAEVLFALQLLRNRDGNGEFFLEGFHILQGAVFGTKFTFELKDWAATAGVFVVAPCQSCRDCELLTFLYEAAGYFYADSVFGAACPAFFVDDSKSFVLQREADVARLGSVVDVFAVGGVPTR